MRMLLKNARVIDPSNNIDDVLDIRLNGGIIIEIGKNLEIKAEKVLNMGGYWLTPGLVDMHTHLRDPGQTAKETIKTGTMAARAGGYTSVCCMANTSPVIDNVSTLNYLINKAQFEAETDVWPIAAVTKNLEGKELTNMSQLLANGAVAFSDDGKPITNMKLYRFALQYSAMFNVPIISHAEELQLSETGVMNESYNSTLAGLPAIPYAAESMAIAKEIELLRFTGGRIHFAHVSTKAGVNLIRRAKEDGLNVTCDTAPHYFSLTDETLLSYDTNFKMNPPLRSQEDVEAIKKALSDGIIDVIATDHAPHTYEEKALDMNQAPNGIVGLETSLGLIMTNLVNTKVLTPMQAIYSLTKAPSKILNIPRGNLSVGSVADITIINPELEWVVDSAKFKSKGKNTPFNGFKLRGKAVGVFKEGILHYDNEYFIPEEYTSLDLILDTTDDYLQDKQLVANL